MHSNMDVKSEEKMKFSETSDTNKQTNAAGQRWKVTTVVMLVINVILLVSILTVTIIWRSERAAEGIHDKQEPNMCLECKYVYSHPDDIEENQRGFDKRMEGNKTMCCGRASKHLDELVASNTQQAHQKERNLRMLLSNPYICNVSTQAAKPSAHLVGVTKSLQDMHEHHMLKWNQTGELSNTNGVEYKEGKIRLTTSGFYFVYSQITYQDNKNVFPYSDKDIVMHHSIHKEYSGIGDIRKEKLLESSQSKCQMIVDQNNKTSYIGAVFYLKEDDLVHVRVSHPPKLLLSKHSNFFGLYLT